MQYTLQSTKQFDKWFAKLKDPAVRTRVLARFVRVENGSFGDFKQLSANLFELRFFFASGLRIYYTVRQNQIVLLLVGGDKSTQSKDIEAASRLIDELEK
ncbi:type II toxin-antitoxin system RelE/ParE family toxin [Candidatus Electronema sp. JC]|uniref:type II toxin-antitoxin system RelE/ParE family toxin n=1 Tax=Candidatus Electronema sp. JC TaxID=3401570 RepID=UPI003AA89C77